MTTRNEDQKFSYCRGTAQRAMKSCQLLHNSTKIAFGKTFDRRMTFKVTQGHRKWRYTIGHVSLLVSGL